MCCKIRGKNWDEEEDKERKQFMLKHNIVQRVRMYVYVR